MIDAQLEALANVSAELQTVESELEEKEERMAGLETMLEVKLTNTDEFTQADVELTETQLVTCSQDITELEDKFGKLTAKKREMESEVQKYSTVIIEEPDEDTPTTPPMSPTAPSIPGTPLGKDGKRLKIISELIETERTLVVDLNAVVKSYFNDPGMEANGIDKDMLFCNIDEVATFAESLLVLLEEEQAKPVEAQAWGQLFLEQADTLKDAYVKYCVNYDSANVLYNEEYVKDDAKKEYLARCHVELNKITKGWDLNSFLIKPVQRIMKYPMLLMEILMKTDKDHTDWAALDKASQKMGDVAKRINEGKRTKELTERYGPASSSAPARPSGRGGFLHAVSKKGGRILEKMSHGTLGKDSKENSDFADLARKIKELEMSAKDLKKSVTKYRVQMRTNSQALADMGNKLQDVYAGTGKENNAKAAQGSFNDIVKASEVFFASLDWKVLNPLAKLLQLFEAPNKLVEKRADKWLDCERMRRKYNAAAKDNERQKAMASDKDIAENTYTAMNKLLLEELPSFLKLATNFFGRTTDALLGARLKFATDCRNSFATCDFISISADDTFSGIKDTHTTSLKRAATELAQQSRAVAQSVFAKDHGLMGIVFALSDTGESRAPPPPRDSGAQANTPAAVPSKKPPPPPKSATSMPSTTPTATPVPVKSPKPVPVARGSSASAMTASDGGPLPKARSTPPLMPSARSTPKLGSVGSFTSCAFTFEAESQFELTINEGERLQIVALADPAGNDQWVRVQNDAGYSGYVPRDFVSLD